LDDVQYEQVGKTRSKVKVSKEGSEKASSKKKNLEIDEKTNH